MVQKGYVQRKKTPGHSEGSCPNIHTCKGGSSLVGEKKDFGKTHRHQEKGLENSTSAEKDLR